MTNFENFRDQLSAHFNANMADYPLFTVDVDRDKMWELYLDSFPIGANQMYRKRRYYDCSECRSFIKKFGAVVAITDKNEIISIWDFDTEDPVFAPVAKALRNFVHSASIERPFMSECIHVGVDKNVESIEHTTSDGKPEYEVLVWHHFHVELPTKHVCRFENIGHETGERLNAHNALVGSLTSISVDAVDTVLDLIRDNLLYRGGEWEKRLEQFKEVHEQYDALETDEARDIFCYRIGYQLVDTPIPFLKNRSIGPLLTDITEGKDIEEAVRAYEAIVDPGVYKRPKPIFTAKMKEAAKEKIVELGFEKSLTRRFAVLDDITINDILFADRRTKAILSGVDEIFAGLESKDHAKKAQSFDGVPEVTAAAFISDILPNAEGIEVYVDNSFTSNFVSLVAPCNADAKSMFNWGNGFSWAYTGNATDSFKEKVQEFGGKTDGVMRFSIKWNESGRDSVDLDAHCACRYPHAGMTSMTSWKRLEQRDEEIYFGNKHGRYGGELDVDIRWPDRQIKGPDKTAVENITWSGVTRPRAGQYAFYVHQYNGYLQDGFRAEIELDGTIYSFDYGKPLVQKEKVIVAFVGVGSDGSMAIDPRIPIGSAKSKKVWEVNTLEFHPVTAVMYSPNHWSTADHPCGHKHLFFMLEGCQSNERPSGIFNEYLVPELSVGNRKVMAALSDQLRVQDSDGEQLSGLGFALDKRAELIVKVHTGETAKVMKVTF